jgi:hypothetical protein
MQTRCPAVRLGQIAKDALTIGVISPTRLGQADRTCCPVKQAGAKAIFQ